METRLIDRVSRAWLRLVARLVPRRDRAGWLQEWEAEVAHARLGETDMLRRVLGSFHDAAWLRRQFTRDADVVRDALHAARMSFRAPGFTAMTVLIFAMGIGATTTMVSILDALFLRPLVIPQAEQVVTVWQHNRHTGERRLDVAPGNAIDWLARARSFRALALAEPSSVNLTLGGESESLGAARVTEQFFDVLRVAMLHGRTFLPQEYRRGAGNVAILGHAIWRERFGADPSVVGRPIRLDNGQAFTVVGVMPPGLELRLFDNRAIQPEPLVWLPKQGFLDFEPTVRGSGYWNVVGRLAPGMTVDQARAEFEVISAQLMREYPRTNTNIAAEVVPLRTHLVGSLRDLLPVLLGSAALLLLVACANIANLLLVRGVHRNREFAVRSALGAGRGRLVRQLLTESLLLATVGGAVGLGLTRWTLDVIGRLRPLDVARIDQIDIDSRAALIAWSLAFVAALVAGLTPSIQLSRIATAGALEAARVTSRLRSRSALVIVEVALASVLAVGAGLLVRSFLSVQSVDPGFNRENVAALQLFASPRIDTREKRIAFFQLALDRLRALPGVVAVGGVSAMPFGQARIISRAPIAIAGRPAAPDNESGLNTTAVAGDYFRAMGVPLLEGRLFDPTDTATSRQVVLISRAAARRFWSGTDPIGSRVKFRFVGMGYDAEVVGVVGDVQHEALDQSAPPEMYVPYSQSGFRSLTFVARTAPGAPAIVQRMKETIWELDPLQSIYHAALVDDLVSRTLLNRRFSLFLLGGFAIATLLLAWAGVYGVISFATSQRRREFGVRVALGADRRDIVMLVLREGLTPAALGVVVGVGLAVPLTSLLRSLLFGVTATDPVTFVGVGLMLVVLAAAACYVPARRALAVAPADALRPE